MSMYIERVDDSDSKRNKALHIWSVKQC